MTTSLRYAEILGKAAIPFEADGLEFFTEVKVASETVHTTAARDVAVDGHPVANLEPCRAVHGHDLACILVTGDGRLTSAGQALAIGATDSGGLDAHHHIPAPRLGSRHFVKRNPILTQKVDCEHLSLTSLAMSP
jgi:hypothetical protein